MRTILFCGMFILVAWAAGGCGGDARQAPNVILVMVDSLRADYLGSGGFRGDISPNIDRFAKESVSFSDCVSQASWTKPSVASLFTSAYPSVHRMTDPSDMFWASAENVREIQSLSSGFDTLAEGLQKAGYVTSARSSNPWIEEVNGFSQGFTHFRGRIAGGAGPVDGIFEHISDLVEGDVPFFLYLHFMEVHAPYRFEEEEFQKLRASPSLGNDRPLTQQEIESRPAYLTSGIPWGPRDRYDRLVNWKANYAVGVKHFDRRFGKLYRWLEANGVLDDTVVILTADHGEEFLEHDIWEHGWALCRHQNRVPLMIRLPKAKEAGRTVAEPVQIIDLMPTIFRLTGTERTGSRMQGRDLSDKLYPTEQARPGGSTSRGVASGPRPAVAMGTKTHPSWATIQLRNFSLLWEGEGGGRRLFDLDNDPHQQIDVAGQYPEIVESLTRNLESVLRDSDQIRREPERRSAEAGNIEMFRALGYAE